MRIEHVALWSDDLQRLVDFYVTYFDGVAGPRYDNPSKGFASRFVSFDDGARLEVMQTTTLDPVRLSAGEERMGLTHLAMSVDSRTRVDALTARLDQDGFVVAGRPRITGDGYYESVVLDPDGNRIEIVA